jgi:hypothetical protein
MVMMEEHWVKDVSVQPDSPALSEVVIKFEMQDDQSMEPSKAFRMNKMIANKLFEELKSALFKPQP